MWRWFVFGVAMVACCAPVQLARADTQVNVISVGRASVQLSINHGRPQTLTVGGTSPEGVKLLSSDGDIAMLEIEGKIKHLARGQGAAISSAAAASGPPAQGSATLYRDTRGHFIGQGSINGKSIQYLVDTGASSVAMNGSEARWAGVDYLAGKQTWVSTANGAVKAYQVTINTLKLGNITLHQVEGMVLEGDSPPIVLMGMSALNRLEMKYEGLTLTLSKKY